MKPIAEQSLYELLEVPADAPEAEIVKAWERMEALYGPGSLATYTLVSPEDAQLLARRLDEALTVLLDPAARKAYDERLAAAPQPSASGAGVGALRLVRRAPPTRLPPIIPAAARPAAVSSPPAWPAASAWPAANVTATGGGAVNGAAAHGPTAAPAPAAQPLPAQPAPAPPAAPEAPSASEAAMPPPAPSARPTPPPGVLLLSAVVSAGQRDAPAAPGAEVRPAPPSAPTARPAPPLAPATPPVALVLPEDGRYTGAVLRSAREARGISIVQMCERTKITRHHLENLEADRYDKLPVPVYLRGYLMAIARELRLDGQKVARSYVELWESATDQAPGKRRR